MSCMTDQEEECAYSINWCKLLAEMHEPSVITMSMGFQWLACQSDVNCPEVGPVLQQNVIGSPWAVPQVAHDWCLAIVC